MGWSTLDLEDMMLNSRLATLRRCDKLLLRPCLSSLAGCGGEDADRAEVARDGVCVAEVLVAVVVEEGEGTAERGAFTCERVRTTNDSEGNGALSRFPALPITRLCSASLSSNLLRGPSVLLDRSSC